MADISVTLTLDDSQFQKTIKSVESKVDKFGSSFEKSVKANTKSIDSMRTSLSGIEKNLGKISDSAKTNIGNTTKLFENLKAVVAGISFGALIVDAARLSTEIVSTAKSLNISTAAAVGFQKAVAAAGGDADNARDALISLSQKLGEAKTQGGDALDAFNQLGVSLTELATSSPEQMMFKVVKALGNVKDATLQADIQNRIFGEDIKNTDFNQLASQLDKYVESAKGVAPAMEAARKSQLEFNNAYTKFQGEIVKAVPWDTLTEGIQKISDNMEYIGNVFRASVNLIKDLGGALLWMGGAWASLKVITGIERLYNSFLMSGSKLIPMFAAQSGAMGKFGEGITRIVDHAPSIRAVEKEMGYVLTTGSKFRLAITDIGSGLLKIIPFIGQVIAAFQLFDFVIESITGKDVAGWFEELYNVIASSTVIEALENQIAALSKMMDIDYESEAAKIRRSERMRKAAKESLKQLEDEQKKTKEKEAADKQANAALAEKSKLIRDTAKTVQEMANAFSQSTIEQQKNIKNQIDMLGIADDYKVVQQELINLDNARLSKISELNDKRNEAEGKPELQAEYAKGIALVNAEYEKQIGNIKSTADALVSETQAKRLSQFVDQQRISTTQEYHNLMRERISVLLPELEKKYYDIENAAQDALIAQVELEAQARGIKPADIPTDVYDKIYKATHQNIEAKKEEAKAIVEQRRQENFLNVEYQDTLKSLEDIKSVQKEIAYDILPWQQRVSQQLIDDAEKRAKAEIDAENARRGLRGQNAMDLAEEKKYTDALVKNAKDVASARLKSMQDTRTFAYGWKAAMQSYVEEAGNAAKKAGAIFEKMMSGMEDLIVNFVKTGKFEWKNFLAMMLEELLRAQIQAVFASMIGDMTGALKGSSGGGLLSGLLGGGGKESSGGILGSIVGGIGKLFGISGSSTDQFGANENGKITQDISGNGTQTQGGVLDSLWNGIKGIGGSIFGGLKDLGGSLLTGLDKVGSWLGDIGGNILDGLGSLSDVLGNLGSGALTGLSDLGSWIGSGLSGLGSLFAGFFATGGKIPEGQFGMVAEKGPEMVNGKLYTKPTLVAGPATVVPFDKQNPYGNNTSQLQDNKVNPYNKSITNNSTNPYGNNTDMSNWSVGNLLSLINSGKVKNNNGFITMNGESVATNLGRADTGRYSGSSGKIPPNIDESKKIADEWFSQMTGASAGAYQDLTEKLSEYKAQTEKIKTKKAKLSKDPYAIQSDVSSLVGNANSIKFELEDRGTLDLIKRAQFWNLMPEDNIANAPNGFYASWWLNDKLGGKPESKSKLPEALQNGMISGIFKDSGIKRYHEDDINAIFGINQYLDTLGQSADGTVDSAYKFRSDYETKLSEYHKKLAAIRKAQEEKANEGPGILSTILGAVGAMMGGWGGLAMSALSAGGKFSGLYAEGGNIPKGYWGIAGEAGPEVVQGPATITPFDKMNSGTNITYNINAVDAMSFKQMLAKDPSFVHGVVMQGAKGIPMR